ncbi:uncharacterized protein LOC131658326 [Vicia villosa]|uniref:uncharacterized protein LOC131658326 n=1 Tax=Vicia villosa TaxID=3911 RepID=UPI00273B42D1|nr:uncharacterized protein LOC131658326 [Vicia villosa]
MARPIEFVRDINDSKDLWKISVRCKHIWSVTSASKKEHIEMILVDSKGSMIQAVVPPYLVTKFKEYLSHGCSYVMQNFKVGSNDFSFKSTGHKHKLVFCGSTSVKKTDNPEIPVNFLNLLSLADIVDGKFHANILVGNNLLGLIHALGGVVEITQSHVSSDNSKSKVVSSFTNNSFKGDFPKLSDSSVQVTVSQNSYYSDFDKFVWKADILSLVEIGSLQQETTCVTVATLDKFDVGQAGWFKLEILAVDGKCKAKFIFWDVDCVKLVGKSAVEIINGLKKAGEYDPLEFPYELDSILKRELAIRAVFQPKNGRLSVIGFRDDQETRNRVKENFRAEEVMRN